MECTACPQDRMSAFDTHHRQNSCCLPAAHLLVSLFMLVASHAAVSGPDGPAVPVLAEPETSRVEMTIGQAGFTVTLADTPAARALGAHLPLLIDMAELNGNEKHAALPQPLPVSASRPGTIHCGDIMLYGSSTLVVFYRTFSSPYAYTRIGRVEDATNLARALGAGHVRIRFSRPAVP